MDPIRMQMDIINMVIRADDDTLRTILAFVGKITSGKPEVNRWSGGEGHHYLRKEDVNLPKTSAAAKRNRW